MILASSNPHDDLWIKVLGARVVVVSLERPYRRRVLIDAGVDGRVAIRLGRVLRVVGDITLPLWAIAYAMNMVHS
jgi:hypothetical protein